MFLRPSPMSLVKLKNHVENLDNMNAFKEENKQTNWISGIYILATLVVPKTMEQILGFV